MRKGIRAGLIVAAAFVLAAGAGRLALAKGKPAPSGNMNLRIEGSEGVGASQTSVLAIGQELVDTGGTILGDESFTYVDSASASTGVCDGTASGSITFEGGNFATEGSGQFDISLTFMPTTPVASTICQETAYTLLCNRTLVHKNLADDLNAGQYHCVATSVMVTPSGGSGAAVPSSMKGDLDIVSGSNAPTS